MGHDGFRDRGWGGATQVAHHIGDEGVTLMADSRDNGNRACSDGARQRLVVEGHQVLEGTATTYEHDLFGAGSDKRFDALDHGSGGALALNTNAGEKNANRRAASAHGTQHVVHRSTVGARHQTDDFGIQNQRTLAFGGGEPLFLQLGGKLGNAGTKLALALERKRVDREVHPALRSIDVEPTVDDDALPNLKVHIRRLEATFPHHARKAGGFVLDGEVNGLVAWFVGNLGNLTDDTQAHIRNERLGRLEGGFDAHRFWVRAFIRCSQTERFTRCARCPRDTEAA